MVKKKSSANADPDASSNVQSSDCVDQSGVGNEDDQKEEKRPIFKAPTFQHTIKTSSKKKTWRSLKQIIAQERSLQWPKDAVHYSSITAPPSFKPAKKYSDISGLIAKYTDPQTKLFYASSEEFSTVRSLPSDIIAGYLTLRGANNPIG